MTDNLKKKWLIICKYKKTICQKNYESVSKEQKKNKDWKKNKCTIQAYKFWRKLLNYVPLCKKWWGKLFLVLK